MKRTTFDQLLNSFDDLGRCATWLTKLRHGGCFVAGTLVSVSEMPITEAIECAIWGHDFAFAHHALKSSAVETATQKRLLMPIEHVPLGARVATKNPKRWEVDVSLQEPDQATWGQISFTVKRTDGAVIDAELIRPRNWIEANGIEVGGLLPLNIGELDVVGVACVTAIEDCPRIAYGEGSVVTGRFLTRQVTSTVQVAILGADGAIKMLEGTPIHPVWSLDRNDWVPLGKLQRNERLLSAFGAAFVESLTISRRSVPVYNMEVNTEHVYEVGLLSILVHNSCQVDVFNIGEHALHSSKNWHKMLGNVTPTLDNIRPFVDDVIANGTWVSKGVARGPGGEIIGEIVQAEVNGVYVRGLRDLAGKIILNNAGVL